MPELVKVGMADYKVGCAPATLISYGLGSCIGISIYDPQTKIGGLLHIMLPDSTQIKDNSNIPKFADTGIEELVRRIVAAGGNRSRLVAKIAGGAQMFAFQNKSRMVCVGERNVEATKAKLKQLNIPILAEDTGLNFGRTVVFYPGTGEFQIKAVGKETYII